MAKNLIQEKAKKFALRIIKLYKYLHASKKEYIMSKQILRSGTSIGANLMEAEHAQSRDDFLYKQNISLKEANETKYWLELLYEAEYILKEEYESVYADCEEMIRLLAASIKKLKS